MPTIGNSAMRQVWKWLGNIIVIPCSRIRNSRWESSGGTFVICLFMTSLMFITVGFYSFESQIEYIRWSYQGPGSIYLKFNPRSFILPWLGRELPDLVEIIYELQNFSTITLKAIRDLNEQKLYRQEIITVASTIFNNCVLQLYRNPFSPNILIVWVSLKFKW